MEKQPIPEEIAQNQKTRILSDAELIKRGADYVPTESSEPRLEVTKEQVKEAKSEMDEEFIRRREESERERQKNMSEKEIAAELEQKMSDIAEMVLKNVKGAKINKNWSDKWGVLIEKDAKPDDSFNRRYWCKIGVNYEKNKIYVEITEFSLPGIQNTPFRKSFSSALTAKEIGSQIPWSEMGYWHEMHDR